MLTFDATEQINEVSRTTRTRTTRTRTTTTTTQIITRYFGRWPQTIMFFSLQNLNDSNIEKIEKIGHPRECLYKQFIHNMVSHLTLMKPDQGIQNHSQIFNMYQIAIMFFNSNFFHFHYLWLQLVKICTLTLLSHKSVLGTVYWLPYTCFSVFIKHLWCAMGDTGSNFILN